jgi:hypothetical protein
MPDDWGLKVWDEKGKISLDTSSRITRLVYQTYAGADVSDCVTLPDIEGEKTGLITMAMVPYVNAHPHLLTRSGNVISWSPANVPFMDNVDSAILVYIYS